MNSQKIRTGVLISLIMLSLFQIGILWEYGSHGLPFNFFWGLSDTLAKTTSDDYEKLKKDIFYPSKLIFSAGSNEAHWIVKKDGDLQEEYKKSWDDATNYLGKIVSGSDVQSAVTVEQKWEELVLQKSIVFEFDAHFTADLATYFLNAKSKTSEFVGFKKLLLSPWGSENYNTMDMYILDNSDKVKKYVVGIGSKNLKKEYYEAAMAKMNKLESNGSLRSYSIMSETKVKLPYPIRQDMLVVSYGSKYEPISALNVSTPEFMKYTEKSNLQEIEGKLSFILGADRESYEISIDNSETVIMKNLNNIYRVYKKGILEYRKILPSTVDRGSESDSLKVALEFMSNQLKNKNENVQIYLSSIKEEKDRFRFVFDYRLGSVPLQINLGQVGRDKLAVNNAIVIEAKGNEVLSCLMVLRNIDISKDRKQAYNVNFIDLLDQTFNQYPQMRGTKGFAIKDFEYAYVLKENELSQKIEPSWVVITGNDEHYDIKLPAK